MQAFVGNYVAPSVGEGLEPGDIRPFAPATESGTSTGGRHSDSRFRHAHHQERNADIVLMLDS